jgi:hypothetical protein
MGGTVSGHLDPVGGNGRRRWRTRARGKLITTARDPEDFQTVWKLHRKRGVLTMVTYGPAVEPGPAVVV